MIGTAQSYDPGECKARVLEEKQMEIQQRIEELNKQRALEEQSKAHQGPDIFSQPSATTGNGASSGAFGGVFDPNSLSGDKNTDKKQGESSGAFGGVFDPNNLQSQEDQ